MWPFPVEPMLAASASELPTPAGTNGWLQYELKFDGYRAQVRVEDDGRVRLQSRNGTDMTAAFPEIADAAAEQLQPGTLLDGELVIWRPTDRGGTLDFPALQQRLGARRRAQSLAEQQPATLVLFDALWIAGGDFSTKPLRDRSDALDLLAQTLTPPLQRVPATRDVDEARAWMTDHAHARLGIEGLVVKPLASRYEPGKRGWTKVRIRETVDVVVGAVTGSASKPSRLIVGYWAETSLGRRLRIAGSTVSLGSRQARDVGELLTRARAEHPWPETIPGGWIGLSGGDDVRTTRVDPSLVIEVSADTAFERGRWRHLLKFLRARPDIDANTVGPPPDADH